MPTTPSTDRSDAELICADFAVLFDRHATAVHRYLARRIGTTIADDLLAQTFLVAYERRRGYDRSRADARPWLYGIATNLLRRYQREEIRQYRAWARTGADPVRADCHSDRVAEQVDAGTWSGALAGALAALKPPDREVLLLVAWCELSYHEIAEALDIPIGTVRSRLHRARATVRAVLPSPERGVPTPAWLAALPRDPDALLARLYDDPNKPDNDPANRYDNAFLHIAQVLSSGLVPADLRAALYTVAATRIPGITVVDSTANLDGQQGVAVGRVQSGPAQSGSRVRQDIIFDSAGGQYIGERQVTIGENAQFDVPSGTAIESTAVRVGVADEPGFTSPR